MADLIRFVDSIVANPVVRLDMNDEPSIGGKWATAEFKAPPPMLRRSLASNAMRDGSYLSSAQYESRIITMKVDLICGTQEQSAVELQRLARELDRTENWLMYQPTGSRAPVFFLLQRGIITDVIDIPAQAAIRQVTVELQAEPFALGLREDLGPFVVTNDPTAVNGHYFDVTGVIGDVAAPAVLVNTTRSVGQGILAVRQHGDPTFMNWWKPAESMVLSGGTANPGGGPDAAMAGTGTNNYVRTTFATTTMDKRLEWQLYNDTPSAERNRATRGTYRAMAVVRRTDSTSVIKVQLTSTGTPTTLPLTTNRIVVDLGLTSISTYTDEQIGYSASSSAFLPGLGVYAQRVSGTGNLDWDYVVLVPADESQVQWGTTIVGTSYDVVLDATRENVVTLTAGTPFDGSAIIFGAASSVAGGLPSIVPDQVNRFVFVEQDTVSAGPIDKTHTSSFSLSYWPQYLFVRPASS
jgi:hypothetical protein